MLNKTKTKSPELRSWIVMNSYLKSEYSSKFAKILHMYGLDKIIENNINKKITLFRQREINYNLFYNFINIIVEVTTAMVFGDYKKKFQIAERRKLICDKVNVYET